MSSKITDQKVNIVNSNWNDVKQMTTFQIAVLPWGACEPHGEHLSYCTDTLLASIISYDSVMKTKDHEKFMILPCVSFGSQNPGQTNKCFCIHMSIETQKMLLKDIVKSLEKQGVNHLVIVNGHNGNNFKTIVRDLEFEFEGFKIYVCNYLDIANHEWIVNNVYENAPKVDDHAGFTETSLMLHYFGDLYVDKDALQPIDEIEIYKETSKVLWTPRDWDIYSHNTRIGYAGDATEKYGEILAEHITDELSKELDKITEFKI